MIRLNKHQRPLGIFDSGVGGLSVFREVQQRYPAENLIYIADQAHVPYGTKTREEVLGYSAGIVRYLLRKECKLIVIACNTASAVSLAEMRKRFPDVPFVGMEPAVKPAAADTRTGVVGVLATPATFQGDLYATTVQKFARGVKIMQDTCPGLVNQIESGFIDQGETQKILEKALKPMLAEGVDEVVIGCTHYPFVIPLIKDIVGESVNVVDPAPAVARQVGRILREYGLVAEGDQTPQISMFTTGDPVKMKALVKRLLDLDAAVDKLTWEGQVLQED